MNMLLLPFQLRYLAFTAAALGVVVFGIIWSVSEAWAGIAYGLLVVCWGFFLLGLRDLTQPRHSVLRNYPITAHLRFLLEKIRPEMRQYFFEADNDGAPFPRDKRAVVYQRAKRELDKRPFGTQYDVYGEKFEWLHHSVAPKPVSKEPFRITIGGPDCTQPYSASVLNISAMSYGSLSANAIRALNAGAKAGQFAHDTGEGGLSPYHEEHGGDIIWEIGSGYFGCREDDGGFCAEKFAKVAAKPQIKMIEIKLSQGAKPGHGGVLPAAKVTAEISAIRGIPMGKDCVSPATHAAFSTPLELMAFIAELRRLSGGKPVGFKLCIGHPWEFLAMVKAMRETNITPDFIVVDGKEGGTGAAPIEFMDHIGMPLREGLTFVHAALVGASLRDRIRIGASGKITTAFDMARVLALGADWCNAARGFMFAVGCIQAQSCHTDRCPTGVATQDPYRQRALVVPDKATRVASFHRETVKALAELIAAAGLSHPQDLRPQHFMHRIGGEKVLTYAELYSFLKPGELLSGTDNRRFRDAWAMAQAKSFAPLDAA